MFNVQDEERAMLEAGKMQARYFRKFQQKEMTTFQSFRYDRQDSRKRVSPVWGRWNWWPRICFTTR